jgi:NADPH:quinone reductase-like Zn-dependent oxidoreductase
MRSLEAAVWPWIASGEFRPVVDSRFSFANAADAHRGMESSAHVGKIVLVP